MSVRVSTLQMTNYAIYSVNQTAYNIQNAQLQLDSGLSINQPSDNPTGMDQALTLKQQSAQINQYSSILNQANSYLTTGETALGGLTSLIRQSQALAIQAANGTLDSATRLSISQQIGDIINQVVSLANTRYGNNYIFSGQRTSTQPIVTSSNSFAYQGGTSATGDANINLEISQNQSITVNATADKVFLPALQNLQQLQNDVGFGALSNISNADLANLQNTLNTTLTSQADMGAKIQQVQAAAQQNTLSQENVTSFLSQVEDANIPQVSIQLQSAQTAYQAALAANSKLFQMSMLNYFP